MSWSSGKDSAWALHVARTAGEVDVVGLLTTVDEASERIAMHAVRRRLLDAQAERLGLPVHVVALAASSTNEEYEQRMRGAIDAALAAGVEVMVFGDLYLEDVRAYRERMLAGTRLRALFPLWGLPTGPLAREIVSAGVVAWTTCVDAEKLDASFLGRRFDEDFLAELPSGVDRCGENGEFHTFVSDAPGFAAPIDVRPGEVVEREGFLYADLVPL